MKKLILLAVLAAPAVMGATPAEAKATPPYVLRDTTGFPPPPSGMARIVVTRERTVEQTWKPEFVFVDGTPVGMLPQKTGVTALVPPGIHRVWLGRGARAEAWVNMMDGGRYLIRMRETMDGGAWRADLVRDSPEGYSDFAVAQGLKLAITTPSGMGALNRNLVSLKWSAAADSAARQQASHLAPLPILFSGAWFQDLLDPKYEKVQYMQHPGRLVIDETSVRYYQADTVAVDISRASIENVRFGGIRDNRPNPWIKIAWRANGEEKASAFAHSRPDSATIYYNRLFGELTKTSSP